MSKKVWSIILKIPLIILVIASFVGGLAAAIMGIQDVTYGTPILIGIILVLYFIGVWLGRSKKGR